MEIFILFLEFLKKMSNVLVELLITKLPSFIGSYKFHTKFNFHRFAQKLHEFHIMINMNDICITNEKLFLMTYVNVHVYYTKVV